MDHLDLRHLVAVFVVFMFVLEIRTAYFKRIRLYLTTLRWTVPAVLLVAALALVFGMSLGDQILSDRVARSEHLIIVRLYDLGHILGHNAHFWMVLCLFYFFAALSKRDLWRNWIFGAVISSALTGATCHFMKFIFLRARPFQNEGPFSFFNGKGWSDDTFQSMPSGDVSIIAGFFLYLAFSVKNYFLKIILLVFPLASAVYRVRELKHWPSDTLFSFLVGIIFVLIIKGYENYRFREVTAGAAR